MKYEHIEVLDEYNIIKVGHDICGTLREAALFTMLARHPVYFWQHGESEPTELNPHMFASAIQEASDWWKRGEDPPPLRRGHRIGIDINRPLPDDLRRASRSPGRHTYHLERESFFRSVCVAIASTFRHFVREWKYLRRLRPVRRALPVVQNLPVPLLQPSE